MSKLPQIFAKDLRKILIKNGFRERAGKGSHRIYVHPDGRRTILAFHRESIAKGTLRAILRQTGFTFKDLLSHYHK